MTENELSKLVVDLCIKIHRVLGPGLLESVYERVLCYGARFERQKEIAVVYEGVQMNLGFRAEIIVEGRLLLELKSTESVTPVHHKILLTYLRLTNLKLGLMINFREELLKNGIKRILNKL